MVVEMQVVENWREKDARAEITNNRTHNEQRRYLAETVVQGDNGDEDDEDGVVRSDDDSRMSMAASTDGSRQKQTLLAAGRFKGWRCEDGSGRRTAGGERGSAAKRSVRRERMMRDPGKKEVRWDRRVEETAATLLVAVVLRVGNAWTAMGGEGEVMGDDGR